MAVAVVSVFAEDPISDDFKLPAEYPYLGWVHFKDPSQNPKSNCDTKGRVRKKNRKKCGLLPNWGGRVSEGSKMPNFYFGKVFFQLACRIILGPPKHVLHLV